MVPTLASPVPCLTELPTEVQEDSDAGPKKKKNKRRKNRESSQRMPKKRASPLNEMKEETSATEDKHQEMTTLKDENMVKEDAMDNAETLFKDDTLKSSKTLVKDDALEDQEGKKEQREIDTKEPEEKQQPDQPEVGETKIQPVDKLQQESEAEQTKEEPKEEEDQQDQHSDQPKIEEAKVEPGTEEAIDKGPSEPNTEKAVKQPDVQLSPGTLEARRRQKEMCSQPKFIPREGNEQDARIRAQRDKKIACEKIRKAKRWQELKELRNTHRDGQNTA